MYNAAVLDVGREALGFKTQYLVESDSLDPADPSEPILK